jgi:hypothetical protein
VSQWIYAYGEWDFADETKFEYVEYLVGGFEFSQRSHNGELGEYYKEEMLARYDAFMSWSCYFYDEVFALARTFDWFLASGQDYEDHSTMMDGIRKLKFTGCSGKISYVDGTNDRYAFPYSIQQLRQRTEGYGIKEVGIYDPLAATPFSYIDEGLIWPDGASTVPGDTRIVYEDCGRKEEEIQDFPRGKAISYISLVCVATVTFAITVMIMRKFWWNQADHTLLQRHKITLPDIMIMVVIFLEFLQYISIGPNVSSLS